MGKVELKIEIDADLLARARAAGVSVEAAAEAGVRSALSDAPRPLVLVEGAREKAKDPEGAAQRAREWAEANRDAIDEFNRHVREHGLLSDQEPFKPHWLA